MRITVLALALFAQSATPIFRFGYPVQISAWSNWAGAYSTSSSLLVVSSLNEGNEGSQGLESVFHEAMHQWDDAVAVKLKALATANNTRPPSDNLDHAILFYTAGEAVRRIVPGHTPMADVAGIWNRGLGSFKPALDTYWNRIWMERRRSTKHLSRC